MSAQIDSAPLVPADLPLSRRQAKRALRAREERDLELATSAGRGNPEAIAALAERLASRVERIARALMGSSREAVQPVDADDAAVHALVELLRSTASYRGKEPLERWADRTTALSVLRFARAVRRRSVPDAADSPLALVMAPRRVDERTARTFEQYLRTLSEPARQTLLLRHALGLKLSELADALQCSASSAREQLIEARSELRALVRRRGGEPAPLGVGAARWCAQRDRQAIGESLRRNELEELAELEARDPEVWAFVAQVRALELYFEAPRTEPTVQPQPAWVARAVAALRVSAPASPPPRASGTLSTHQIRDLEGSRVVRWLAVGASVALAASTVFALIVYRPERRASGVARPAGATAGAALQDASEPAGAGARGRLRPTVEALPKVMTAAHGPRLRRDGRVLTPGTLVAQGDLVEAMERPGCLEIEPDTQVCLALGSSARLVSISAQKRQLELTRGRAVVRVGPGSAATRIVMRVGALEVSAGRVVFAVERSFDGKLVRVRALRGALEARADTLSRSLSEASSATFRPPANLELAPLLPALAQRDWEVLATGLHPPMQAAAHPVAPVQDPAATAARVKRALEDMSDPELEASVPAGTDAVVEPEGPERPGSAEIAANPDPAAPGPAAEAPRDVPRDVPPGL
ncbi:MAG: ECF-family polymerase sigma factor [Myxococcaceae bacterium]|nr:ECF-family polymerase sigma factor [Myxococcaceae bacterium]